MKLQSRVGCLSAVMQNWNSFLECSDVHFSINCRQLSSNNAKIFKTNKVSLQKESKVPLICMPCRRYVYKYRGFKSESIEMLWYKIIEIFWKCLATKENPQKSKFLLLSICILMGEIGGQK